MTPPNEIFVERFKRLIGDVTLEEIAEKIETNKTTVHNWKNGASMPTPIGLVGIAKAYNVSVDWLLGLTNEKEPAASDHATSSSVSSKDDKSKTFLSYDNTSRAICQEEIVLQLESADSDMLTVYQNLSDIEKRAWDLGEVRARIVCTIDRIREGTNNGND